MLNVDRLLAQLPPDVERHSRRVANLLTKLDDYDVPTEVSRTVALLHDYLEDGPRNKEAFLTTTMPPEVVASIEHLTRKEGEPYARYIKRLISSNDPIALDTKICDILDHLHPRNIEGLTASRQVKYMWALEHLLPARRQLQSRTM